MTDRATVNPFYRRLRDEIASLGGMFNAHLHLDRAGTLDERYMASHGHVVLDNSHISLHEKHSLINVLHNGPAYAEEDLSARINACLDVMVASNTRRADSLVDVSADCVGLDALHTMSRIKHARAHEIDLQIGAYSPFGFRDDAPERWETFAAGAEEADFIAALPEADDTDDYPGHIGFEEHCRRMLALAQAKQCALHVHTDQRNEPSEDGTERLIRAVRECGAPPSPTGEPMVWAVHMISPSTYAEPRFRQLVDDLLALNIGVICCPSAAIGMRQLRPLMTPTYNSIPRVLELLDAGVQVRLASDNIADICSPSTTADLIDEVFVLSAAIRFYDIGILARLAAGKPLTESQRQQLGEHLQANDLEIARVVDEATKAAI